MKLLTFIMAFLVLALSLLPCADMDAMKKDNKAKTELAKKSDNNHDDHRDACSPFCHCACCSIHFVVHRLSLFSFHPFYSSTSFHSLIDDDLIERALPVWQPPQLV